MQLDCIVWWKVATIVAALVLWAWGAAKVRYWLVAEEDNGAVDICLGWAAGIVMPPAVVLAVVCFTVLIVQGAVIVGHWVRCY